jgi:hypothetical protein
MCVDSAGDRRPRHRIHACVCARACVRRSQGARGSGTGVNDGLEAVLGAVGEVGKRPARVLQQLPSVLQITQNDGILYIRTPSRRPKAPAPPHRGQERDAPPTRGLQLRRCRPWCHQQQPQVRHVKVPLCEVQQEGVRRTLGTPARHAPRGAICACNTRDCMRIAAVRPKSIPASSKYRHRRCPLCSHLNFYISMVTFTILSLISHASHLLEPAP